MKKYSNKLSMKALAGWIYVLVDSIFRIETVLGWVFQQVIHRRSYVLLSRHVDEMGKNRKSNSQTMLRNFPQFENNFMAKFVQKKPNRFQECFLACVSLTDQKWCFYRFESMGEILQLHWLVQSATSKRKWLNFSLKIQLA